MADVYVLAHILPACGSTTSLPLDASLSSDTHTGNAIVEDVHSFAAKIWKRWLAIVPKEIADEIVGMVRELMQDLLIDIQARPRWVFVLISAKCAVG